MGGRVTTALCKNKPLTRLPQMIVCRVYLIARQHSLFFACFGFFPFFFLLLTSQHTGGFLSTSTVFSAPSPYRGTSTSVECFTPQSGYIPLEFSAGDKNLIRRLRRPLLRLASSLKSEGLLFCRRLGCEMCYFTSRSRVVMGNLGKNPESTPR